MTRDEELRKVFLANPYHAYMAERRPIQGHFLWVAFIDGANAAMDLLFEPGAVRFGPPTAGAVAALRDAKDGDIVTPHDLGGES